MLPLSAEASCGWVYLGVGVVLLQHCARGRCTLAAGSSMLEEVSSRRRQIHSVAVLAQASAEVATPLVLSATLKVPLSTPSDCIASLGHLLLHVVHTSVKQLGPICLTELL